MDPVTTGIATNLLAAGLMKGSSGEYRRMQTVLRHAEFSAEIDEIETEFSCALQDAVEECDTGRETGELTAVTENWDAIVERLYHSTDADEESEINASERLVFEDEADAIDRIARAIAFVDGYDLDETPQLKRKLKRAVAEAYQSAVDSFGERVVEAGLTQEFLAETAIEELAELDQLQERLDELEERFTRARFYDLYSGSDEDRKRASRAIDPRTVEFVSRPELDGKRGCERLLVLGPGGSGKSRALAELVVSKREIEHVIVPRLPLQSPQDLQPLRNESFEGDVLLVWDDIHAISPETGNTVFRKAVSELEDILDDDHTLHVLAAARTNQVESLPGDVWNTDSPLWSAFKRVEFGTLDEDRIAALFDRVLAKEEVAASEEVREAFVEKALETDPSPLYVTSVVETAEGERLTREEIEVLPEDALAIWEDQYAEIKATNDERRFVLWAVKFLSELRSQYYYHSLLKGIYAHVLDRDELTFGPPVEELCQRQWLVPTTTEQSETRYVVHDVKAEAIDESIDGQLRDLSEFLFDEVDRYLPPDEQNGVEHVLHENCGNLLKEYSLHQGTQLVAKHYKRAIVLVPDCATVHTNYAHLLETAFDKPKDTKNHYEQALAINLPDTNPDTDDSLWFESVHAVLTETDLKTPYTYGLTSVLEDDPDLATELFELIWENRTEYPPDSDTHRMALSAGVALAATIQLHDEPDSFYTCDGILDSIDQTQLEPPANDLFEFLDTGTAVTLDAPPSDEPTEEMTLDTLEPQAFAYLLERLNK